MRTFQYSKKNIDYSSKSLFLQGQANKYKAYTVNNFRKIPQIRLLSEEQKFNIEVVSHVLPFKTNNYVINELINWDDVELDPLFLLTFPQKEMLKPDDLQTIRIGT